MALMLGSSPSFGQQTATLQELYAIENLISGKDCGALYSYVSSRSHLVTGGDSLASELRKFMRDVEAGRLDCYKPTPVRSADLRFRGAAPIDQTSASLRFGDIY
jgi:hypothetical protein